MAFASNTLNQSFFASFAARIAQFRTAAVEKFQKYKTYRSVLAELSSLTDRDLADMNMSRTSLDAVARQAAGL